MSRSVFYSEEASTKLSRTGMSSTVFPLSWNMTFNQVITSWSLGLCSNAQCWLHFQTINSCISWCVVVLTQSFSPHTHLLFTLIFFNCATVHGILWSNKIIGCKSIWFKKCASIRLYNYVFCDWVHKDIETSKLLNKDVMLSTGTRRELQILLKFAKSHLEGLHRPQA